MWHGPDQAKDSQAEAKLVCVAHLWQWQPAMRPRPPCFEQWVVVLNHFGFTGLDHNDLGSFFDLANRCRFYWVFPKCGCGSLFKTSVTGRRYCLPSGQNPPFPYCPSPPAAQGIFLQETPSRIFKGLWALWICVSTFGKSYILYVECYLWLFLFTLMPLSCLLPKAFYWMSFRCLFILFFIEEILQVKCLIIQPADLLVLSS